MQTKKCYFYNVCLNNNFNPVKMYDGRTITSCGTCRELVADAKNAKSLDMFCLSKTSGGEMK